MLEQPLTADFAFVKAWKGDTHGNLVYRRTARNFNPAAATGLGYDDLKTIEAAAFLKRVTTGTGPGPTLEDAVAAARVAAAADRAASLGGWQEV